MKKYLMIFCTLWMISIPLAQTQISPPLKPIQTIPLPNVEGYFDHPAVDIKGQRLFVPGEYQKTIEVVDLRAGKVIHEITGLEGNPRKVIYIPPSNQVWVNLGKGMGNGLTGDFSDILKKIGL